jgi:membrane fusion protein
LEPHAPPPAEQPLPLFRRVAIDHATGSQIGDPLNTYWRGMRLFTATAFTLIAALILLLVVVEYSPVHRVPCYVDAAGGLVRLSAPADGRIRRIAVDEGTRVEVGDVLAVLDTDTVHVSGNSQHAQLNALLQTEQAAVAREADAASRQAAAEAARAKRLVAGLSHERESLLADILAGEELVANLQRQAEQIGEIAAGGYASKMQLAKAQGEVLTQRSRVSTSRAALNRVERDISVAESEHRATAAKLQAEVQARERAGSELARQMLEADANAEQIIRALQAGVISSAVIARGQSVVSGQALFTLMPNDEALIMRLLVPPRAVASVKSGKLVKLSFDAYPREKFGQFVARVERVSDLPVLPAEAPATIAIREPAFVAVATLVGAPRGPDGEPLAMKPGMLAEALVPIETRRAIEWLLDPFLRGFNRSAGRNDTPTDSSR